MCILYAQKDSKIHCLKVSCHHHILKRHSKYGFLIMDGLIETDIFFYS